VNSIIVNTRTETITGDVDFEIAFAALIATVISILQPIHMSYYYIVLPSGISLLVLTLIRRIMIMSPISNNKFISRWSTHTMTAIASFCIVYILFEIGLRFLSAIYFPLNNVIFVSLIIVFLIILVIAGLQMQFGGLFKNIQDKIYAAAYEHKDNPAGQYWWSIANMIGYCHNSKAEWYVQKRLIKPAPVEKQSGGKIVKKPYAIAMLTPVLLTIGVYLLVRQFVSADLEVIAVMTSTVIVLGFVDTILLTYGLVKLQNDIIGRIFTYTVVLLLSILIVV